MAARSFGPRATFSNVAGHPGRLGQQAAALAIGSQAGSRRAGDHLFPPRRRDEQRRLCVRHEIVQLRTGIGGVERQPDRARPQGGEIKRDRLRTFVDLRRHPVAGLDAPRYQRLRQPGRQRPKPGVSQDPAVRGGDESPIRRGGRELIEKMRNHGRFVRASARSGKRTKAGLFPPAPARISRLMSPHPYSDPLDAAFGDRARPRRSRAIRPISPASTRSSARRWRRSTARCWCWPARAPARRAC